LSLPDEHPIPFQRIKRGGILRPAPQIVYSFYFFASIAACAAASRAIGTLNGEQDT